jgi:hypothetical protein
MPFVAVQKAARARRIRKARKLRPEWQDIIPADQEQRQAYAIAARHVDRFSRAMRQAVRDLAESVDRKKLERALRTGNVETVLETIEWFDENDPALVWQRMDRLFRSAFSDVMEEAGKAEAKRVNKLVVRKQDPPITFAFDLDNPFTEPWIAEHAGVRVAEVSAQGQLAVRAIVEQGFRFNEPPADMARAILDQNGIGLLEREVKAVNGLEGRLRDAGVSETLIDSRTTKYADRLMRERAIRIARTETIQAEGAAIQQSWQTAAESGFVTTTAHKEWIASTGSERTCEICIELDGQIVPLNQPWMSSIVGAVDVPGSAHVSCFPGDVSVIPAGAVSAYQRRFDGDLIIIRTAKGKELACTPNHPILTRLGWMPAHSIHVGDDVISHVSGNGVPSLIDDNHEDVPSLFHEVADSFGRCRGVISVKMPTAPKDFHIDGKGSEVTVIRANGLLRDRRQSALKQEISKESFIGCRSSGTELIGEGFSAFGGPASCRSSDSIMSRLSPSKSLFSAHARHTYVHGRASVSGLDAALQQPTPNTAPCDSDGFGQRLLGFTGKVALDQVVNVDVHSSVVQVFNLQTESGCYIANGIYVHNCRCSAALVEPLDAAEAAGFKQTTILTDAKRSNMAEARANNRAEAGRNRLRREKLIGIPKVKE